MSEKRRDSKGRILRTGESQRKDGRYAYKYTDACGKTQFVYAWKLVPTDKTPTGKRDDISLREKVKEILRDLNDGIDTIGKKMTVCQLYARQNSHRKNVKRSTEKGREYLMSVLKSDPLDTVDNSQINVLTQRTMHRICTAATNEEVSFAYRVAIPRQRFRWRNAFSTRWRSL